MVGTLTDTLKDLKDEMWGIKEQVSRVEDRPPNQTYPTSPVTTSTTASSRSSPSLSPRTLSLPLVKVLLMGPLIGFTKVLARGGPEQPVHFHQEGRETTDPKDPTLIQEESHSMEYFWYAVADERHARVWNICRSWEEASEFLFGYL